MKTPSEKRFLRFPANAKIVARNAAAANVRGFFRRWMQSRRAAEEK